MTTRPEPDENAEDLPLLGEQFAVELANSRYRSDHEDLDFLRDADVATRWFSEAPAAAGLVPPHPLGADVAVAVRRARDATRGLLGEIADGAAPSPSAAETLHDLSRQAPAHLALDVAGASPSWLLHFDGRDDAVFVASVAARCILFLGGDDAARVRRCARPACPMLFVQHHRARRFCHESCAHSVRQARYYRARRPGDRVDRD